MCVSRDYLEPVALAAFVHLVQLREQRGSAQPHQQQHHQCSDRHRQGRLQPAVVPDHVEQQSGVEGGAAVEDQQTVWRKLDHVSPHASSSSPRRACSKAPPAATSPGLLGLCALQSPQGAAYPNAWRAWGDAWGDGSLSVSVSVSALQNTLLGEAHSTNRTSTPCSA
eukprot:CAMPEP_0173193258 /NCGR_PEP_ID=MMETSP1141-20130122/13863_1 /TAXON_ID=483371 /ORGANISM="non described non described, Strain CCMP2298" /LENGTH=166 /DNA_ID=CAMNT_0014117583 /DNA_START=325 /DNA_END=826 /DNA_ORIENTATION=+